MEMRAALFASGVCQGVSACFAILLSLDESAMRVDRVLLLTVKCKCLRSTGVQCTRYSGQNSS